MICCLFLFASDIYVIEHLLQVLEFQQRKCCVIFDLSCNLAKVLEFCTREIPQAFLSGTDTNLRRLTELVVFILNHITSAADAEFFDLWVSMLVNWTCVCWCFPCLSFFLFQLNKLFSNILQLHCASRYAISYMSSDPEAAYSEIGIDGELTFRKSLLVYLYYDSFIVPEKKLLYFVKSLTLPLFLNVKKKEKNFLLS